MNTNNNTTTTPETISLVGRVLSRGTAEILVMSDLWAWEDQTVIVNDDGSTSIIRGVALSVDITPELKAVYDARQASELEKARVIAATVERMRVAKDKMALVIAGRKIKKGTIVKVIGLDKRKNSYSYQWETIAAVILPDGSRIYTNANNLEGYVA